jgi:A/G-specific adenine glycosylase
VAAQCVARRADRIDELPARRPRKPLPVRRATWPVLLHRGAVLLERRPSEGLWGGLWVFPETDVSPNVKPVALPEIEHGFTHFRLIAKPMLYRVKKRILQEKAGRVWLDLEEAARAAVPVPVRRLLCQLRLGLRP